ncbi:MAG: PDZ domain-containing protein [Gemmatimonadaceae bacterium]
MKSFTSVATLAALLSAAAPAAVEAVAQTPQRPPAPSAGAAPRLVGSVRLGQPTVRVPVTLNDGRPVVTAYVNGQGPFRLGIETGSPAAVILYAEAATRVRMFVPDSAQAWRHRADSVTVGGLWLGDVEVAVLGPSPLPSQQDGQLGLAAYELLLMTLDYPSATVSFSRDTLPSTGKGILTLTPAGPLYSVPVTFGDVEMPLALDTQGNLAFSVRTDLLPRIPLVAPLVQTGIVQGPAFGILPRMEARASTNVRIGDYSFERPMVSELRAAPNLPFDGILGIRALQNFTIALDQRVRRLRLSRSTDLVPAPPPLRERGMGWRYSTGPLRVLAVIAGSPAEKAGIMADDVVLEINGKKTTGFAVSDWQSFAESADVITLLIERGGARRTVQVPSTIFIP